VEQPGIWFTQSCSWPSRCADERRRREAGKHLSVRQLFQYVHADSDANQYATYVYPNHADHDTDGFAQRDRVADRHTGPVVRRAGRVLGEQPPPDQPTCRDHRDGAGHAEDSGSLTWTNSGDDHFHLSYRWFAAGSSEQYWDEGNLELRAELPAAVAPGQSVTVRSPSRSRQSRPLFSQVDMVQTALRGSPTSLRTPAERGGRGGGLGVPRRRCRSHRPPRRPVGRAMAEPSRAVTHARGAVVTAPGHAEEQRSLTWTNSGDNRFHLSYRWFAAGSSEQYWDEGNLELRAELPAAVAPGQSVTVPLVIRVPSNPNAYMLKVDMVEDGVVWFANASTNLPQSVLCRCRTLRRRCHARTAVGSATTVL